MGEFMLSGPEDASAFTRSQEPLEVIIRDVIGNPRPAAKIIAVTDAKSARGKSMIAFHLVVGLADAGLRVAAIDLDLSQQSLMNALARRNAMAHRLKVNLSGPSNQLSSRGDCAIFCDDLRRLGRESDIIIIDVAQNDTGIAKRALAIADILVTVIASSFADVAFLRGHDPTNTGLGEGDSSRLAIDEMRDMRKTYGLPSFDWLVLQNRVRNPEGRRHQRIKSELEGLSLARGFRLAQGLADRGAYRELFSMGLCHLDIDKIPQLPPAAAPVTKEILAMLSAVITSPPGISKIDDRLATLPQLTETNKSSGLVSFFQG